MFSEKKKRLPIPAKVKNEVFARAKGYCENSRCKIKNHKMKKNQGNFHHTRAPHIRPTAKTVQFLCPNCHQWHGHSRSTKTTRSLFGSEKEVIVKRNRVGARKPKSTATKKTTKKKKATPKKKTTRTRKYSCNLTRNARSLYCNHSRAGKACLTNSLFGGRCNEIKISYK